jgi:hypothetical protein
MKEVSMREYFEHEERKFTPWLSKNLDRLSSDDLLKIEFDEKTEEKTVIDNKSVDIVAKNTDENIKAVIENQFEKSDSDHLGRSLVYASDEVADIIVWIAENFLERHTNTIRWLNSNSEDDTYYFAIEVSLRQIGDSPYAVEFQAHERPDRWEEKVEKEYLAPKEQRRLEFWQDFQRKCENLGIDGSEPNEKASHGIFAYKTRKRPAYIRPTVHYNSPPKNMIRFYDDSRGILREENKKEKLEKYLEESISELDTELTPELLGSQSIDIDDSNDFDKLIFQDKSLHHDEFNNYEETLQWMIDTTLILRKTLIRLSEEEIEAEPR